MLTCQVEFVGEVALPTPEHFLVSAGPAVEVVHADDVFHPELCL